MSCSFVEYWVRKVRATPQLGSLPEGTITLTFDNFRKELERAYNEGVVAGSEAERVISRDTSSLFDRIFGKSLIERFWESRKNDEHASTRKSNGPIR